MGKYLDPLPIVGLIYHFHISAVEPLKFENGYVNSSHLYLVSDYLSMIGINLIYVLIGGAPCYI